LEIKMSEENHSRRRKVLGFIIAETVAIAVLLVAGTFGLWAHSVDSTVTTALNIVMLAAAGGVATIPILFFALPAVLPRDRR
jgi:hypothetical protein